MVILAFIFTFTEYFIMHYYYLYNLFHIKNLGLHRSFTGKELKSQRLSHLSKVTGHDRIKSHCVEMQARFTCSKCSCV